MTPSAPYAFAWSIHPSVVLGTAVLGALYVYGIGPLRRRLGAPRVEPWRPLCWFLGLLVLFASLNGPVDDLSDGYLFSVHMVQHLLLTMVMPPLLIAGLPGWLADHALTATGLAGIFRALTRPLVAGLIFSVTMIVGHLVPVYDLMTESEAAHIAIHLAFMASATLFWWPAITTSTVAPPLSMGLRILYIFAVSLPMQAVAAVITIAGTPLYRWYTTAPRTFGLSPLDDQKLGGLLMWIPGNLWMFGAMAVVFFRWAKETE